jgi:hypothetical protein
MGAPQFRRGAADHPKLIFIRNSEPLSSNCGNFLRV